MAAIHLGVLNAAFKPIFMVPALALVGALLGGALIIALVRRWHRGNQTLGPSASDQLADCRKLYEQGDISEEEYKRLRAVLSGELLRSINRPAPAPDALQPSEAVQPALDKKRGELDPPAETGI